MWLLMPMFGFCVLLQVLFLLKETKLLKKTIEQNIDENKGQNMEENVDENMGQGKDVKVDVNPDENII